MNYGFVIDNDRCIGCHACSTACKSENDVPLGVHRTWVKSVQVGEYPNARRHFQVSRCNHCANPPCVRICPVTAMYQRDDGIVEFDAEQCIGCKACLQACPYDAIHIDPDSGTAAKCHYCAHRVDLGLEPACVVVCPTHAILAGDLDDPGSEIARHKAGHKTTVRRPEQGTAPKLFYVSAEETALRPTATPELPPTFAWADAIDSDGPPRQPDLPELAPTSSARAASGARLRPAAPQGSPYEGPVAAQMLQLSYNVQHRVPWHWPVPAYLLTKGIGTGVLMLLGLGYGLGLLGASPGAYVAPGLLALAMLGLTTALLVLDLERPERFLRILTRPQWRSWLTRGAYLLVVLSGVATTWWLVEMGLWMERLDPTLGLRLRLGLLVYAGLPLAIGGAVYTAYLFGQAEGRDLWQSPLLPIKLLLEALVAGAAALLLLGLAAELPPNLPGMAWRVLEAGLVIDLLLLCLGELAMPHATEAAARASELLWRGPYRRQVWLGGIAVGHLVPLALLFSGRLTAGGGVPAHGGDAMLAGTACIAALVGIYAWSHAYVMAPQRVPNS